MFLPLENQTGNGPVFRWIWFMDFQILITYFLFQAEIPCTEWGRQSNPETIVFKDVKDKTAAA